ncbi:MAG: M15 family metallopeptidase [Cyanobacteria bacterium P01_G01_bin.54]
MTLESFALPVLKPPRTSKSASDDIPIATRDVPGRRSSGVSWLQIGLALFLGSSTITMGAVFWWWRLQDNLVTASPELEVIDEPAPTEDLALDNVLGHLPYDEASEADLVNVTADGRIRLQAAAAERYQAMAADARANGIYLAALSGYRTVEEQEYLFFEVKAQRNQDASKRAEVSAPPGFSEHHTGYAIDIGDTNLPHTHLSESFENTPAFAWLAKNAARYSFELSFLPDNIQGIAYEPWHWRFVGDRASLETFYRAQNLPTAEAADAQPEPAEEFPDAFEATE